MQLRRRREDDGIHVFPRQRFLEVRRHVADAEARGDLLRLVEHAPDQRDDTYPVDAREPLEMLDAERAGARHRDVQRRH